MIVIGAGAIGVMTAYALARSGVEVTLFEMNEPGRGASFGNAGLLVPSYAMPLASLANALEGLRSLTGAASAVDLKLRANAFDPRWMVRFLRATGPRSVERGLHALSGFARRSVELYDELMRSMPPEVDYARTGTLYVSRTAASHAATTRLAGRLRTVGIPSVVMDGAAARAHEQTLSASVVGAVWYPDDGRLQPFRLVRTIATLAAEAGVQLRTERVESIAAGRDRRVTGVRTATASYEADRVILAAGSWSPRLAASIGLRVPILPAKGYSVDLTLATSPRTAMLFAERHVSATPMNGVVRATTGLDFHGYDAAVPQHRIDQIQAAYREYLDAPQVLEQSAAWAGFRPLTPDGLPIVGVSSRMRNLVFATGHGALGITLAPVTAEAVTNLILGKNAAIDAALQPTRFGL